MNQLILDIQMAVAWVDAILMRHGVADPRFTGELFVLDFCDICLNTNLTLDQVTNKLSVDYALNSITETNEVEFFTYLVSGFGPDLISRIQSLDVAKGAGLTWTLSSVKIGRAIYELNYS